MDLRASSPSSNERQSHCYFPSTAGARCNVRPRGDRQSACGLSVSCLPTHTTRPDDPTPRKPPARLPGSATTLGDLATNNAYSLGRTQRKAGVRPRVRKKDEDVGPSVHVRVQVDFDPDVEIVSPQRHVTGVARQHEVGFSVGDTSRPMKKVKEIRARTCWEDMLFL